MDEIKISKEVYLNALEIVETYHKQILYESNIVKQFLKLDIKLSYFLENYNHIPRKISNILHKYINLYGDTTLESVARSHFLRLRNAGKMSWNKFINLKTEYLRERLKAYI